MHYQDYIAQNSEKPKICVRKFGEKGWEVIVPPSDGRTGERLVYSNGETANHAAATIATIRTETCGLPVWQELMAKSVRMVE